MRAPTTTVLDTFDDLTVSRPPPFSAVGVDVQQDDRVGARIRTVSVGAEIELSAVEARGVALAAQGLGRRRPDGRIDARRLRRAIDDVGLLQLDSVNVLCRSHYLSLFSRLGPYPRTTLDRLASHADTAAGPATRTRRDRSLFEYWGHEASLLPVELQPLLRWRMARAEKLTEKPARLLAAEKPELLESVLRTVRERGPVRAAELATPVRKPANRWYNWSEAKIALDYLFFAGRVCAAHRVRFERRYDLPERVLPKVVLDAPTPSEDEAQRQLLLIAAARLGVATEPDLGDYFPACRGRSPRRAWPSWSRAGPSPRPESRAGAPPPTSRRDDSRRRCARRAPC